MIDIEFLCRLREILNDIFYLSEPIDECVDHLIEETLDMINEKETEIVLQEIRAEEKREVHQIER